MVRLFERSGIWSAFDWEGVIKPFDISTGQITLLLAWTVIFVGLVKPTYKAKS